MATNKWLKNYAFYLLLVFSNTTSIFVSSVVFITQPLDIIANEGDNMTFVCSVTNSDRISISWTVIPDHQKQERTEEFDQHLTSELTIKDIDQYDRYIICTVSYGSDNSGQYQWRNLSSRRAKLSVQHFPAKNKLRCIPHNTITILEGDSFQVQCTVDRCKPTVDLSWRLEPQDSYMLPSPMVNDLGLMRNLSGSVVASQELHNKRVLCVVTSAVAFPGRSLECPIGPIKVLTPPVVIVHPRNAILEDNMIVGFSCLADGYPQVFNFSWSCSSNVKLDGCNATSVSTNISVAHISISLSPNDTEQAIITCTAINTVGTDTYSSNLMIEQKTVATYPNRKTLATKSCSHPELLNISLTLQEWIIQPTKQMIFWCNVTSSNFDDKNIKWKWYFDGLPITENDEDFKLEGVSMSSFALHVLRSQFSEVQDGKGVLCEVTVCDHTVTSSVNLSVDPEQVQSKFSESESYLVVPPFETPDSQPDTIATWKIVAMAIAGVLVTIVLTACVVALVSILLYRHLSNSNSGTSTQGQQSPTPKELPARDAFYEVPNVPDASLTNVPTSSTEADDTSSGSSLHHTYASEVIRDSLSSTPPQSSSWTSSSDVYMGASPPRKGDVQLLNHTTNTSDTHLYINQDIVEMHELK